ncbi:hypothetical protein, partial [Mesorhizobium sp.]
NKTPPKIDGVRQQSGGRASPTFFLFLVGDRIVRHPEIPQGIFKPKPTAIETKQDATTRAARQIVNGEAAAREQKTERLRLARLASEATNISTPTAKKRTNGRKHG